MTEPDWLMVENKGHALGIKSDNSLWVWGGNGAGQLGLGFGVHDKQIPTIVPGWIGLVDGFSRGRA